MKWQEERLEVGRTFSRLLQKLGENYCSKDEEKYIDLRNTQKVKGKGLEDSLAITDKDRKS